MVACVCPPGECSLHQSASSATSPAGDRCALGLGSDPSPFLGTNVPPHFETSRSLGRGKCHCYSAKFARKDVGQWLHYHKGKRNCLGGQGLGVLDGDLVVVGGGCGGGPWDQQQELAVAEVRGWTMRPAAEEPGENETTVWVVGVGHLRKKNITVIWVVGTRETCSSECTQLWTWLYPCLHWSVTMTQWLRQISVPSMQSSSTHLITDASSPGGRVTSKFLPGFCFSSTYTKTGMIQRGVALPPHKDDLQICDAFRIFENTNAARLQGQNSFHV